MSTALQPTPALEDQMALDVPVTGQRAELARCLVDVLCLPAGQMNENERAFAADILNELLNDVDESLKREVSERLAGGLTPPPVLLRRLLLDKIEVATPLIERMKEIPDLLLSETARQSPAHRLAILRRVRITDVVADTILDSREVESIIPILMRPDIVLSGPRIDELVARSMDEKGLRQALMQRLELQPHHGFTMFWWLDAPDRRRVLSRYAIDRNVIQNALKPLYCDVFSDPNADEVVKRILVLCDRRHRPRGKHGEAVSMDVVERMLTAVRANPTPDLCGATGLLAGVSPATASRVLYDEGGEPFSVLCKSIGLSRSAYADILAKVSLIRKPDAAGPVFDDEDQERLLATFDMIARDYSRTILRYWDWRQSV